MMENTRCKRWLTTNQDEFQNPITKKIDAYVTSEEFGRYEDCMTQKACEEEAMRQRYREAICCAEQNAQREPTFFPTDSHIDPELKATKAPWCRCLATGDPNLYEENREEAKTDDMCYCRMCYNQVDVPTTDNPRAKIYSSTNFIDYRDPNFPFIENKLAIQKALNDRFWTYKKKVDAEDAKKERKLSPQKKDAPDRVEANCIGNYDCLPPAKIKKPWEEDQSWFREESPECVKNLMKKFMWSTTYREMNKDGAALPLLVRALPKTCIENPPGDPVKIKPELAPCTLVQLGDVFEKWDRPQIRSMARRCDTIANNPCLDKCCRDKDAYFQEQYLDRTKYAECPTRQHGIASEENLRLARENKLRLPYDRMIPGYTGYDPHEAPPVCKIKKIFNPLDPYDPLTVYQADYMFHPQDLYEHPVEPFKPDKLEKFGISTNPIAALSKKPLPDAYRLSCYLECKRVPCQTCPDGTMSEYLDCKQMPCKPPVRTFGVPVDENKDECYLRVEVPSSIKTSDVNASIHMDIPPKYQTCTKKPKENLMQLGTYVATQGLAQKLGNVTLGKKKEYKTCT